MLVVSLTTTYQRLTYCRATLISLAYQRLKPDKILLWVSEDSYLRDSGVPSEQVLLEELSPLPDLVSKLLNVRWVNNSGPYRKLIPALRCSESDDVIVTADDDIFYGNRWLESLVINFDPREKKVIVARARLKRCNFMGKLRSYSHWKLIREPCEVNADVILTFGGGVVLCPWFFRQDDIDDDSFLEVAATTDDLWYTKLLMRSNVLVRVQSDVLSELNFIFHNDGLDVQNFNKNSRVVSKVISVIWSKCAGYFGVPVNNNDRAYRRIERYFEDRE